MKKDTRDSRPASRANPHPVLTNTGPLFKDDLTPYQDMWVILEDGHVVWSGDNFPSPLEVDVFSPTPMIFHAPVKGRKYILAMASA
jgi:hypothetical protein